MPTSLVSTGVQFPDNTVQTTAATASANYFLSPAAIHDRNVTFSGNVYNSTSSNALRILPVYLNAAQEILFFYGQGGDGLFAAVWDNTTKTFGSSVLVRSCTLEASSYDFVASINLTSSTVLVCSIDSSTLQLQAVVLSVSGTTISVGTAASLSVSGTPQLLRSGFLNGLGRLIQVGSSYVLPIGRVSSDSLNAVAMTVSGTTVTLGSQTQLIGGLSVLGTWAAAAMSSSVFGYVATDTSSQNIYVRTATVSGTTITVASFQQLSSSNLSTWGAFGVLSTGRIAFAYRLTNGTANAVVLSSNGTVSQVVVAFASNFTGQVISNKLVLASSSETLTIVIDTAGTASTNLLNLGRSNNGIIYSEGTNVYVGTAGTSSTPNPLQVLSASTDSPVLTALYPPLYQILNSSGIYNAAILGYNSVLANVEQSGIAGQGIIYSGSKVMQFTVNGTLTTVGINASGATGSQVIYTNPFILAELDSGVYNATRSALSTGSAFLVSGYNYNNTYRRRIAVRRVDLV